MHILIADDDKVSRVLLRRILEQVPGYRVSDANSGEKAWELMDTGLVPDLFMLDLHLPGIGGLELLKRVRADDRLKNLSVVICTAVGTRESVLEAASLDISGYLLKPLSAAKVFEQVNKSVQRTKVREPLQDELRVRNRLGIDAKAYAEMLEILTGEVGEGVSEIRNACEKNDHQGARLKIGAIKGGCRNLGASGLVSILTNLENKLLTDASAPVLNMLEQLKAEHAHLEEVVQERRFGKRKSNDEAKSESTEGDIPSAEPEEAAEPEEDAANDLAVADSAESDDGNPEVEGDGDGGSEAGAGDPGGDSVKQESVPSV